MNSDGIREMVVRRVRLREELKPVNVCWHTGPVQPDWLFITRIAGPDGHESFDLQFVKQWGSRGVGITGYMSYETLLIAKSQAHAEIGVEYVEWEPCSIQITNADGSIDWGRALPISG